MYSLTQIRRGLETPALLLRELNRLYHYRLNTREYNTNGVDIFNESWDTLIILDACRYDMFERISDLPGRLESRISRGSATNEFLKGNFEGRELLDTVYVTANPQLYRGGFDTELHAEIRVWAESGWDETYGTVLPDTVAEAALEAAEEFPKKRHVVHFMQPHYPFLTADTEFDKDHLANAGTEGDNVWSQLMKNDINVDIDTIWPLYNENLRRVLPSVEKLINRLSGKTVVTADHGNMIGERSRPIPIREWGHPWGTYTTELVTVPWLINEGDTCREIVAEEPRGPPAHVEDETVAKRLRRLGYAG